MISVERVTDLTGRVLVEFLVVAKDNDGDIDRAEHGELMSLLEETTLALQKCAVVPRSRISFFFCKGMRRKRPIDAVAACGFFLSRKRV